MEVVEDDLNAPHIVYTADGPLKISTTPGMWTGVTTKDMVKLRIKPVDEGELSRNGFKNTVFTSDHSNYRFFVHSITGSRRADQVSYYVLARPPNDSQVYSFT